MKRILLIGVAMMLLFSTCKKVDKLTHFNMEYNEPFVIPSSTGINLLFNLVTPDIQTNSEATFETNDTRKDLVNQINLKKLDLTLTSPTNGDFTFLKSIEIFISADGLPEEKIAWNEDVPATVGPYLELETSNSDLKEYIKKDKFSLRMSTVTDKLVNADQHINVHSILLVDAKLFKK